MRHTTSGRAFQEGETASAKVRRQEFPGGFKCVPICLEQSRTGVRGVIRGKPERPWDRGGHWEDLGFYAPYTREHCRL